MIHSSAIVSEKAKIGPNVTIGAFTIIHDHVVIGDGSFIGSHCELGVPTPLSEGKPLIIGKNSNIRSHSIFYEGSSFGDRLITGHRVTVRELTVAGENLQIGTLSDIQGHCQIGNFVRTHSNVHIGQKSKIGNFVWIFPYVVLTNDPHPPSNVLKGCEIGDYSVVATMSVILPGVKIANHSLIGAHSLVSKDVAAHTVVAGVPAKPMCEANKIKLQDGTDRQAYPWTTHFQRGYPTEVIESWQAEQL